MASDITPLGSDPAAPLTPPPTDEKALPIIATVLRLLRQIQQDSQSLSSWVEYPLKPNDYVHFTRLLESDRSLWGYVEDKVRSV